MPRGKVLAPKHMNKFHPSVRGDEFREEAEGEVYKRLHIEEDGDFIHKRTLELAQVYAPPEFEFPGEPLTLYNATTPAPSTGDLELVSEFEAESISVGDPRFISHQVGDSEVPHQQDGLDEMEVEAAWE